MKKMKKWGCEWGDKKWVVEMMGEMGWKWEERKKKGKRKEKKKIKGKWKVLGKLRRRDKMRELKENQKEKNGCDS